MDFGLFYFANDSDRADAGGRYDLLLEGARFADQHGFSAVWTPERHFHPFGGLYPNPAVTGAAVAAATKRVRIRAGSVVVPLHHPLRVAEEWAVVDQVSGGRVDISFASGWNPGDFVLAPERYAERKAELWQQIEQVRALWRGEPLTLVDGVGRELAVTTYPRPLQPELPVWVSASGDPETITTTARIGANLITGLLQQSLEDLGPKIALYRAECAAHGHQGRVALMVHTYLHPDPEVVRQQVRAPFASYLRTSFDLVSRWGKNFGFDLSEDDVTEEDLAFLIDRESERLVGRSLIGTPDECYALVKELARVGVDEIACLIDFGIDLEATLASLAEVSRLKARLDTELEDVAGG